MNYRDGPFRWNYALNRFIVGVLLVGLSPSVGWSAGFELLEQSSKGLGQAFAGGATGFGDGSEVFTNPAAMSLLEDDVASIHGHLIAPSAEFQDEDSRLNARLGGAPLTGGDGGNGGETAGIGNLYLVKQLPLDLTAGLGVNSPFGLATEYDDDWAGRYHAVKSELRTININPGISFKQSEYLSIGANMQLMYADAKLTNAIDFGTIGVATLGAPTAASLGLLPQRADGYGEVTGDDWGVGMGLGAVISPSEDVRIGIGWRSRVRLHLRGDADFTVPANAAVLTSTGAFADTDAAADVDLPETVFGGIAWNVTDRWQLFGDMNWIKWDRFEELRVRYGSVQPDTVQAENWDNTFRLSAGTSVQVLDPLTVRAGFAWDQTPIQGEEYRTPRIPDNDRYWLSAGLSYSVTDDVDVHLSYAHLFVADAGSEVESSTGAIIDGSWELSTDLVTAGVTAHF